MGQPLNHGFDDPIEGPSSLENVIQIGSPRVHEVEDAWPHKNDTKLAIERRGEVEVRSGLDVDPNVYTAEELKFQDAV